MPWRETSVIEERLRFVVLASRGEHGMAELCREFGISRQTGYTWVRRYREGGASQVRNRSRRPLHSPSRLCAEAEQEIVALRQRWPDWGAAKIHAKLTEFHPEWSNVSVRTVHRALDRHSLIAQGDRRRPALQRFEREQPNELWQMDFKGPQGFNKGSPVGPLSILDDHSRYLVALRHVGSTRAAGVKDVLQHTFEAVGVPESMLVDHGTPWWNAVSPWGITELTIWIMRQGIRLIYSAFCHPQTQGKVERMHGALQRAVRERKANPEDQSWLDSFRYEYNHIRPHEGLHMATPVTRWCTSPRPFQPEPMEWTYGSEMEVVRLAGDGQLGWRGRRWEISNALRRQVVGIEVLGTKAIVYFCKTPIRELDLQTGATFNIPTGQIRSLQC